MMPFALAEYSAVVLPVLCFSLCVHVFSMIAMMNPKRSWVARWQKQEKYKAGMYAIQVTGTPPAEDSDE